MRHTWQHCESRRDFLRTSLFGLGVGLPMPFVFEHSSLAMAAHPERILVVVEMAGGNDGLNTVIPYRNDAYYKGRPTLAQKKDSVLKLTDEIGLHPSMTGMKRLWDNGQLGIVQGCGYPNPTRSAVRANLHAPLVFSDPNRFVRAGRPAREAVYQSCPDQRNDQGNKTLAFLRGISKTADYSSSKVREAVKDYRLPLSYGSEGATSTLSTDLRKVAALIHSGFPTRVYYVSLGGFDTHADQAGSHRQLLMHVADALEGFLKDMKRIGRSSDVAIMMFTEFGRRLEENQSGGTDHGTATPMYILGEKVKPGLYSTYPSLTDLDTNGDLRVTTDFRSVYATMIHEWMGYPDKKMLLKGEFKTLGAFASVPA